MAYTNEQMYSESPDLDSSKDWKEVKDLADMKKEMADMKQALQSLQITVEEIHTIMKSEDRAVRESQQGLKTKVKILLDNYIDNLSMHGATRVFRGRMIQRTFWAFLMLGVLAYFFFSAYVLLSSYLSNSIIINMQEVHVDELKLPSVTVCDYRGFNCRLEEYQNATFKDESECQDKMGSFGSGMECWLNNTWKNCTVRKLRDIPECLTLNSNQTIVQRSDGKQNLFQFQVQAPSEKLMLFFHQHNELPMPFSDVKTYVVEDGVYNAVMNQKNYIRLPNPYPSQCIKKSLKEESLFLYTRKLCKQHCYAKSLLKRCGALNAYWRQDLPSLVTDENTTKANNLTEHQIRKCFLEFLHHTKQPCECKVPCEEIQYSAKIEKFRDLKKVGAIKMFVYFETMETITHITELPSYDITRFLADMGGIAGLLLGMSILSVFEVIFCLVLFIANWILS